VFFDALLKAIRLARGIQLGRAGMAEHASKIDKMFLGGRTCLEVSLRPLGNKFIDIHAVLQCD